MRKNIGFVSTRFAGTDGVSLESNKWAENLEKLGHTVFWFAGEHNKRPEKSILVPEAHFQHSANIWINDRIWGAKRRDCEVTRRIHELRLYLKLRLYQFLQAFNIDFLIVENALAIPMNIPLGLALTEVLAETEIPSIAHHHDFFWERERFSVNSVNDYLCMAFPPRIPNLKHIVINSVAQEQLSLRTSISSQIVPNVLDFDNPPAADTRKKASFKREIGLGADDIIILQPTRIIQRKGIEHTIDLIHALADPKYKLIISHEAGDEGFEYLEWLEEYAVEHDVDLIMVNTCISDSWNCTAELKDRYSLWDLYSYADFITYPSLSEGFGNALLEAIYFKKPILVNRYATFIRDIEPLGFEFVTMDGFLSKKTIQAVKEIMASSVRKEKMTRNNYEIASRHYSYSVLQMHLTSILSNIDRQGQSSPEIFEKSKQAVRNVRHFYKEQCAGWNRPAEIMELSG